METKFKKGDKFKAIRKDPFGSFKDGEAVTINGFSEGCVYFITENHKRDCMSASCFDSFFVSIKKEADSPRLASDMTIRERFAMAAMQGFMANPSIQISPEGYANDAVLCADALINALNENQC